ncbi:MAG: hypothetical protein H7836_17410, partial [Magnetococcus sp. YQC-3]
MTQRTSRIISCWGGAKFPSRIENKITQRIPPSKIGGEKIQPLLFQNLCNVMSFFPQRFLSFK